MVGGVQICDETSSFSSKSETFTYADRTSYLSSYTGIEEGCIGTRGSGSGTTKWSLAAYSTMSSVSVTNLIGTGLLTSGLTDCSVYHCYTDYF